jgi:hypothetical protein
MKQYTESDIMTEQLMWYMICVIVVEIWSPQNTPLVSKMLLTLFRRRGMKGDYILMEVAPYLSVSV